MSGFPSRDDLLSILGDPVRWRIVTLVGEAEWLDCEVLQRVLPVSKQTVSYHTTLLARAGLIDVHRQGRTVAYTLHWEALRGLVREIATLVPEPTSAPVVTALPTW